VTILEARDRIGGRILTHRDPASEVPIELGAEFIHGMSPEIFEPLETRNAAIVEVQGDSWCVNHGRLTPCSFLAQVDKILGSMDANSPDLSFTEFLERRFPNSSRDPDLEMAKRRAIGYVSGFNAADPTQVGVHWLVAEMEAEEKIQGHRAFRIVNGYAELIDLFRRQLDEAGVPTRTGTVVERVEWRPGRVEITVRGSGSSQASILTAAKVLITLPLGVLQAPVGERGAIEFAPALPSQKLDALSRIEMGTAMRVVLRFHRRFWETIMPPGGGGKTLHGMSFLFSEDEWFPTWWTSEPRKSPTLTGWAPFRAGTRLSGQSERFVMDRALSSLGRLLRVDPAKLEEEFAAGYFHDWQNDPFSRGAYSYGKVGANEAQQTLAAPVEETLFFAGEATDVSGNNGTVHGAISSGHRAAAQILRALS